MTHQTHKILGVLLLYPTAALIENLDDLYMCLSKEKQLSEKSLTSLDALKDYLKSSDLIDVQEQYVALFDRKRLLSLHLFEHIHGDSRDRGQAMVDLMELYKSKGLNLDSKELPDYLPLFLEFLSLLPSKEAEEYLGNSINVISAVGLRLHKMDSPYSVLFDALQSLTTEKPNAEMMEKVQKDKSESEPDMKTIDEEWEEKPVGFLGNEAGASECHSCPSSTSNTSNRCA